MVPTFPLDDTLVAAPPDQVLEARLEAAWRHLRRVISVGLLAAGLALVGLLLLGAVVAPFDDQRSFASATVHIAGRLWFVGAVYTAAAIPVANRVVGAGRHARRSVHDLVFGRGYGRWLVVIGLGAPVIGFAVLEPTAALIVVAVLVAAVVLLALLGVGF